jgi:hypothetical protein
MTRPPITLTREQQLEAALRRRLPPTLPRGPWEHAYGCPAEDGATNEECNCGTWDSIKADHALLATAQPQPAAGEQEAAEAAREWLFTECSGAPVNSLTALILARAAAAREKERERCCVIARGACRAGEKCMTDGGCNHVPCITARMIEGNIRANGGAS